METTKKRKRAQLTLEEEIRLIEEVEKKTKTKSEIAREFDINPSTLTEIVKKRETILSVATSGTYSPKRKRLRCGLYDDVENALFTWFTSARDSNIRISGPILSVKAEQFAKHLGYKEFKASNGFIERFKNRKGIVYRAVCGESNSVDLNVVCEWKNKLSELIRDFDPKDIFNADETALFYRCEPDKTLHYKGEKCSGGKKSKERVSLLLGANMDGSEKLKPLMIGKFENPRCFKGLKSLPLDYKANKRAWMTGQLYTAWLRDLDRKFTKQKRKVLLFVDNCPAHPTVKDLKSITVKFFPPNATSYVQPMDQGVIHCCKLYYRKHLIERKLATMEKKDVFKINLTMAMSWLRRAWGEVRKETIEKCFKKAGFSKEDILEDQTETTDEADADNLLDDLPLCDLRKVLTDSTLEDYVRIDEDVCSREVLLDVEIVEDILAEKSKDENIANGSDEEDDPDEYVTPPSINDAHHSIDILLKYLQCTENAPDNLFSALCEFENFLSNKKKRQTRMADFFKPN